VCERNDLTVDNKKQQLSLHGFERPGDGWIVGRCPGSKMRPVELSPETIELVRDWSRQRAEAMETSVRNLRDGTTTELFESVRKRRFSLHQEEVPELFTVKLGDPERALDSKEYGFGRTVPSWEQLKATRLAEWTAQAKCARERQQRAEERIKAWTLHQLRKRDPVQAAKERLAAKKVIRGATDNSPPRPIERSEPDAECTVCGQMYFSADGATTLAICGGCWKGGGTR
jgi:SHS2 domain-containing protein